MSLTENEREREREETERNNSAEHGTVSLGPADDHPREYVLTRRKLLNARRRRHSSTSKLASRLSLSLSLSPRVSLRESVGSIDDYINRSIPQYRVSGSERKSDIGILISRFPEGVQPESVTEFNLLSRQINGSLLATWPRRIDRGTLITAFYRVRTISAQLRRDVDKGQLIFGAAARE